MENQIKVYSREDKSLFFQMKDEEVPEGFIYFYSTNGILSALMVATAVTLCEAGIHIDDSRAKPMVDSKVFNKESIREEVQRALYMHSLLKMCGTEAMDD